jgi:hypothetical protein
MEVCKVLANLSGICKAQNQTHFTLVGNSVKAKSDHPAVFIYFFNKN